MNEEKIQKPEVEKTDDINGVVGRKIFKDSILKELGGSQNRGPLKDRMPLITKEFKAAYDLLLDYPLSVTVFGSARTPEGDVYYEKARRVGDRLAKAGYAVVTGGGPGIMEAANRGAFEAGGHSIGFGIDLPREQAFNKYLTKSLDFNYFFSRKVALAFSAEAYLYFPGGFGTMDEFFEILTLVQTHKIQNIPIVLIGEDYWKALDGFIQETLCEKYGTVEKEALSLYSITDDEDEILNRVVKAPIRLEQIV
jgi:uncharacterized protein (TIGR00730 family)